DVGQVHQSVDATVQTDEDTEVGDRLDLAADTIALVVARREIIPRVALALLHTQRDAAPLLVDVQHHDLDLVADLHDLRRIDVLVGPVHLGDVHQAFDALLDLDETAVIGDVGDLAEQARGGRITAGDRLPGIRA